MYSVNHSSQWTSNCFQFVDMYLCGFQSFAITMFYEDFYTYVILHMVKFFCRANLWKNCMIFYSRQILLNCLPWRLRIKLNFITINLTFKSLFLISLNNLFWKKKKKAPGKSPFYKDYAFNPLSFSKKNYFLKYQVLLTCTLIIA